MLTNENMEEVTAEGYAWVMAYVNAGFTRDEAFQIYLAWQSRSFIQQPPPAQASPELEELMAKTRLIADATIEHMNEADES